MYVNAFFVIIMVVDAIVPSTNNAVEAIINGEDLVTPPRTIMSIVPIQVIVSVRVILADGLIFFV